jgi:hypothetical protein
VELTVLPVTLPDEFHAGVGSVSYDFVGIHLAQRGPEAVHDFFRMVHAHRLTVDALYLHPHWQDGQIDWQDYDAIVAPLLDGTAFAPDGSGGYVGPGANQPVRRFVLPVDWNWPVPPSHSEYEDSFTRALVEVERHILERGWTRTQWSLFINSTDEPRRLEDFEALRRYGRLLRQAPLRQADLFRHRIDAGPFKSIGRQLPGWDLDRIFREVGEVIDIWNSCAGVPYVPAAAMAQRLAQQPHEEAWFYFSNTAGEPAVGSLLIDGEALGPRTWGWILWRYGFAAGVSWEIGWPSPSCLSNSRCSGFGLHGDASLVYLADALGVPGRVLPSIRLKNLRRGAEDYEYLWLLRQAGQGQLAEAYAYSLVPRALDDRLVENMAGAWHHDPSAWERVRREMGLVLAGQQDPPSIEAVRAGAVPVVLTTPIFSRRASVLAAVFLLLLVVTFVLWPDRRRRRRR